MSFLYLFVAIWTSFVLAEQICISFLLVVKSRINTAIAVSYVLAISLALASGTVRSFKGLQPWLQENTKATHTRYASMLLHSVIFLSRNMNCTQTGTTPCPVPADYLHDRLGRSDPQVFIKDYMFSESLTQNIITGDHRSCRINCICYWFVSI